MYEPSTRPLLPSERRNLESQVGVLQEAHDRYMRVMPFVSLGITAILCVATLPAAKGESPLVVVGFWLAIGLGIFGWISWEENRKLRRGTGPLKEALRLDEVTVHHVGSAACVKLEGWEDLGPWYAFEVGEGSLLLMGGPEIPLYRRFPNTEFRVSLISDRKGGVLGAEVEILGKPLKPVRVIEGNWVKEFRPLEFMEILGGRLEDLESLLRER